MKQYTGTAKVEGEGIIFQIHEHNTSLSVCSKLQMKLIHTCMHLAVKLISVVKRVKCIIGTGVCQVTEFIKMFLPFAHIPVKAFCQGVKPVRNLVLCTD